MIPSIPKNFDNSDKDKLEPFHIFELNTIGNILAGTITKMIINYDPYICSSWIYNCAIIHSINYFCTQSMSFDMAIGKNN